MPLERGEAHPEVIPRVLGTGEAPRRKREVGDGLAPRGGVEEKRKDRMVVGARRQLDRTRRDRLPPGRDNLSEELPLAREQGALLLLGEAVAALPEPHEERVLREGRARPSEVEEDDEVAEVVRRERPADDARPVGSRGTEAPLELEIAREGRDHPRMRSEEVVEREGDGGAVPCGGRRLRHVEEGVASTSGKDFDLVEERWHEVARVRDARLLGEDRGQVGVVLERMQTDPRQVSRAAAEVGVPGLVEMPQEEEPERPRHRGPF
jgi:hypothetical protein